MVVWLLGLNFVLMISYGQPSQPWLRHTIDSSSSGADGIKIADMNGDGLWDIVTGWEEGSLTRLYLHPGLSGVREPWPAVTVGTTPDVEDAVFADLDGDGKPEIISCTEGSTETVYVHWSGPGDLLDPKQWRQEVLPASVGKMMWMYAQPINLDGKNGVDLVVGGKGPKAEVGWFESPKDPKNLAAWTWHTITPAGWIMSILFRDMDGDGDTDLVITDRRGDRRGCRWLENPGLGNAQKNQWPSHMIGGDGLEVMFMAMADTDGDGVEEIVITEKTHRTIRIFERQDAGGHSWQEMARYAVPDDFGSPKSIEVGDMDGDGVADLVYSTETLGLPLHGLAWISGKDLNQPDAPFRSISGVHNAKYDKVVLLDVDYDGDLDVLICEENFGENSQGLGVIWYENPHR